MTAQPKHRMTVDEYLAWAEQRPGRYELHAGRVYAMTPERAKHAKIKYLVQTALLGGIQRVLGNLLLREITRRVRIFRRRRGVPVCFRLDGGISGTSDIDQRSDIPTTVLVNSVNVSDKDIAAWIGAVAADAGLGSEDKLRLDKVIETLRRKTLRV